MDFIIAVGLTVVIVLVLTTAVGVMIDRTAD
jgi:hypothetical protein